MLDAGVDALGGRKNGSLRLISKVEFVATNMRRLGRMHLRMQHSRQMACSPDTVVMYVCLSGKGKNLVWII